MGARASDCHVFEINNILFSVRLFRCDNDYQQVPVSAIEKMDFAENRAYSIGPGLFLEREPEEMPDCFTGEEMGGISF